MNIIIPMAGLGFRFHKEHYQLPKPLIDVCGKPMVVRAVESLGLDGQHFFLLRKDGFEEVVANEIRKSVKNAIIKVIDYVTEGPACSALLFSEYIDSSEELIIANCDQIMEWNPELFLHVARCYDGTVVTYYSDTEKNSYAAIDKLGCVTEIREKEVISNISLNGIHYWQQGRYFVKSAKEMIAENDRAYNGEFYIGPTYNYMINHGYSVGIYHIPNQQHHAVGVPADLEKYIHANR